MFHENFDFYNFLIFIDGNKKKYFLTCACYRSNNFTTEYFDDVDDGNDNDSGNNCNNDKIADENNLKIYMKFNATMFASILYTYYCMYVCIRIIKTRVGHV